jgi:hypothetical protein
LYEATSNALMMVMNLSPETSENFHTLTRLSAPEGYTEFESFKAYKL